MRESERRGNFREIREFREFRDYAIKNFGIFLKLPKFTIFPKLTI